MEDPLGKPMAANRFGTTHWSVVLRAGGSQTDEAQEALSHLLQTYWYPLYAFARRQGQSDHDAMDLTQGFCAHLLSGSPLKNVSPEKGKFRSFLLASFKNYIANQRRAADALRRGGGVQILSLASQDFQVRFDREPLETDTPESLFDRNWVESLLERVRKLLAEDYRRAGKGELFAMLELHLTSHAEALPRTEISRQLGLSSAAVAMSVHRMRRRYGELLRQEVAATVSDPADIDEELRSLMAIVSQN